MVAADAGTGRWDSVSRRGCRALAAIARRGAEPPLRRIQTGTKVADRCRGMRRNGSSAPRRCRSALRHCPYVRARRPRPALPHCPHVRARAPGAQRRSPAGWIRVRPVASRTRWRGRQSPEWRRRSARCPDPTDDGPRKRRGPTPHWRCPGSRPRCPRSPGGGPGAPGGPVICAEARTTRLSPPTWSRCAHAVRCGPLDTNRGVRAALLAPARLFTGCAHSAAAARQGPRGGGPRSHRMAETMTSPPTRETVRAGQEAGAPLGTGAESRSGAVRSSASQPMSRRRSASTALPPPRSPKSLLLQMR